MIVGQRGGGRREGRGGGGRGKKKVKPGAFLFSNWGSWRGKTKRNRNGKATT